MPEYENTRTARELADGMGRYEIAPAWLRDSDDRDEDKRGTGALGWDRITGTPHTFFGHDADAPDLYLLNFTLWGDYAGSVYYRSNFGVLAADMESRREGGEPEFMVQVGHGPHDGTILAVWADAVPDALIADIMENGLNYPVLDEEHLSDLESDLADECWERYGRRDFIRKVEVNLSRLDREHGTELVTDPDIDPDRFDEWFREYQEDGTIDYPVFEDATLCYWPGSGDAARMVAEFCYRQAARV